MLFFTGMVMNPTILPLNHQLHKYVLHRTLPASHFGLCESYDQNSRLNMGQDSLFLLLLSYEHGDRWDSFFWGIHPPFADWHEGPVMLED